MVKTTQSVRFAVWLLISLNLLMAYGSIWIFMRLAPVSGESNARNLRSLASCEKMLTALLKEDAAAFSNSLEEARNNVTEADETSALDMIGKHQTAAFSGDKAAKNTLLEAITQLSEINRSAMETAANKVIRFGTAGAWSAVFMALIMLFLMLIFKHRLMQNVLHPLQEIGDVLDANCKGDKMRRCSGTDLSGDIRHIYNDLNDTLDRTK